MGWYEGCMRVCGQDFSAVILKRIEDTVGGDPSVSQQRLSREVCQGLDWRSVRDELSQSSGQTGTVWSTALTQTREELRLREPCGSRREP